MGDNSVVVLILEAKARVAICLKTVVVNTSNNIAVGRSLTVRRRDTHVTFDAREGVIAYIMATKAPIIGYCALLL